MKKALSMLLAIVMVFSLLPMTAFAATIPTVYFETDFSADMGVGDTFIVKCMLKDNEEFGGFTLSLKWNEDVVKFTGFDVNKRGALISDVFIYNTPIFNPELGIVVANDIYGHDTNGMMFIANFEIIGSGDLDIGLKTADRTEYEFIDVYGEVMDSIIDTSALDGLAVAGSGNAGAAIPEGAPFTAITTDAGDVIGIQEMDDVNYNGYSTYYGVPYYHVQIPEDAEEVYVTHPSSADPFCDASYNSAYGYYADTETWSGGGINLAFENAAGGYTITMPLTAAINDWMYGEVELSFVADEDGYVSHAVAVEANSYDPICFFTFEYAEPAEGGEEEIPTYSITVDQPTGGYIAIYDVNGNAITEAPAGEYVLVDVKADTGYRFNYVTIDGDAAYLENGFFQMPAHDVVISAVFEQVHTCVYDQEVAAENYLKSVATCQTGATYYKSCTCGLTNVNTAETFVYGDPVDCVYVDGSCLWCGEGEIIVIPGYHFATSADVTAENGGTSIVYVKVTGNSDPTITGYNAYDITLTFDDEKLEYVGYEGAVKDDNGVVVVNGNEIRIVGCGADKDFGTEIAALTFQSKAEGAAEVTVTKAQVSNKNVAVNENIPEASPDVDTDETPDITVVVVPYTVTKPGFISGNDKVLHGEDYTFSYTDTTNYTYADLKVTVGGVEVTPVEQDGVYTIEGVTGAVEITATQTANSYNVTKPENVDGPDQATYGEDYIFTVTPGDGMAIESVTVTDAEGNEIDYTINEDGEYVIPGNAITGEFTITVTEKENRTTITFSGVEESEVEGGLTQTAKIGKDFTFKLNKEEGWGYIVKVGETELTEKNGSYTIPAELVVEGGVLVTIEKVDITTASIDVAEYINLDGKTMFLVTAKWGENVLAFGEETMFWSDRYTVAGEEEAGAYCWLVLSTDEMNTADQVMAYAETAIVKAAEDAEATAIRYDYDVNATTKVDVNDAQLVYDMYNASYMDFTEDLPMLKFLEADMATDAKLDTKDVAAVINYIVSGAIA